ncbi:PPOX class F420-dependent oxidoreductase [Amycolatopsis alkalitolerans]|uniref:PPOX class F420-dependent oxidoreductase n=1 Tax=Amycolatopsis alkalitolerans TaxID=2547244 RepID=A0A5C4LSG8_9PSEU|nr:PPOX class F420-dependent oxidoreductase [Amycolatopsis alkalitolerans]TNC19606.1 PPOX class F420-dependent oxidoreductase [Amycolatopsis alkalitolerans]
MTTTLTPFTTQRTVLLTTFRRDGSPVGTPVSIAVEGDHAFVRSYDKAGKAKRLRRNPDAEIAPSTMAGKPTGDAVPARLTLLDGEAAAHASKLLARKHPFLHGFLVPLLHRLKGYRTLHYELRARP